MLLWNFVLNPDGDGISPSGFVVAHASCTESAQRAWRRKALQLVHHFLHLAPDFAEQQVSATGDELYYLIALEVGTWPEAKVP